VRITLISPAAHAVYSGMVPGTLAGLYEPWQGRIDLRALAVRGGVRFVADRAVRLEPAAGRVYCAETPDLAYDVLSIDVGSRPRRLPAGAQPNLLPLKPIDGAYERLRDFTQAASRDAGKPHVVVVGAGAGGVEVAFAVRARLREARGATVTVVDVAEVPLPGYAPAASARVARLFPQYGIEFIGGREVVAVEAREVALSDGRVLAADLVIWASGAEGLPWLAASGLPVDGRGFLCVHDTLRSVGDPAVFAAGDCATLSGHPELPKAGVFAVREGPILFRNLRLALAGEDTLVPYEPQGDFLSLLSTGDGKALLSYHGLAAHGRWVWHLKDWIDRRFIAKHTPPRPLDFPIRRRALSSPKAGTGPMGRAEAMPPCGGCAAKVGGDVLHRVLRRLSLPPNPQVVIGLEAPDDAAVTRHPEGAQVVSTVDVFPPFLDDPFLVGEVAAVNAASDLYAMGAEPLSALALVAVPPGSPAETEETLELLLRGALRGFGPLGVALVGGHTIESAELLIGFAVIGAATEEGIWRKSGVRPGDALVLTKKLGTGVVVAATRAGVSPAEWTEAAIVSMRRPNREAATALRGTRVHACTDVTGFGLAGHLLEMLAASGVGARVEIDRLPALPGAVELLANGWRSSFHQRNAGAVRGIRVTEAILDQARAQLVFDPQTSGGLLAAVPADAIDTVRAELERRGDECHVIGTAVHGDASVELV
jgi:selenide,water dikinase